MHQHPFYPDTLLTTDGLASSLSDFVIVEADVDPQAYSQGHIPGAIAWHWMQDLRDEETKQVISLEQFQKLMSESGINPEDNVVLYGDNNNWFACWAYWVLQMYGHKNVWLLDGGLRKWLMESKPISNEVSKLTPVVYEVPEVDFTNQANVEHVFESLFKPATHRLVDVRSFREYRGDRRGPGAGTGATCDRGGHIPTAISIPWDLNCHADGTFKTPDELTAMYSGFDILPHHTVITYCAIGERASLSWFVLKYLLGFEDVKNFDRSMSYWSGMENAPVVSEEAA